MNLTYTTNSKIFFITGEKSKEINENPNLKMSQKFKAGGWFS